MFFHTQAVIEIFTPDGFRVTDPDTAKSVLTQTAWKKAVTQLRPQDIEKLKDIRATSQEIHAAIAPVAATTSSVIDIINELKSPYFFWRKCNRYSKNYISWNIHA